MPLKDPLGYAWLKHQLHLPAVPLPYESYISSTPGWQDLGIIRRRGWLPAAWPGDRGVDHLEFALKHEGLNLPLLWHAFRHMDIVELAAFIHDRPGGKYTRKAGFLFEWLTGQTLNLDLPLSGNYEPVLDAEKYLCAANRANSRWRVHDNLLGTAAFCPIIERSEGITPWLDWSPAESIRELREHYDPSLFSRATAWLYLMETRSTNEIESDHPSPRRAERFVQVLREAGTHTLVETLSHDMLTDLQGAIIDPQGRVLRGMRNTQNYVGADHGYGNPRVAYPCPPPALASQLLDALPQAALRCDGLHPVIRAAVLAFGFVYIHPFEDGNGRISRYLIHDSYVRDGLTPKGFIFPVSAVILKQLHEYVETLERHSRPIRELADYDFDPMTHELKLHNTTELEPLYRYPDLTHQTAYLMQVTRECADVALVHELDYLDRMDRARKSLRETLDLPDRRLNLLLAIIHQNNGRLSSNKRSSEFSDLTDAEVRDAESHYRQAFGNRTELPA